MTLIFVFFTYQFVFSQKESIINTQIIKAYTVAQNLMISNNDAMIVDDEITLVESLQDFVDLNDSLLSVSIARKNGYVINVTKEKWDYHEKQILSDNDIANKNRYMIKQSQQFKTEVFEYTYPIYFSMILWGDLVLEFELNDYHKEINKLNNNALILAFILFLTSFVISYAIAKMIATPIIKLSAVSEEIAKGDLSKRVDIVSSDEIGRLANSFNIMVASLEDIQKKLKESHTKLEERVEQRTQELNELNENLENRVTTEIKKRQEQEQILIQQSKLASMGEMIGNITHQWRQPLNALSLVMQNLKFTYSLNELDDQYMDDAQKKVQLLTSTMSKTIDDFRNFFKPNKEKIDFSLNELIDKTIQLVESTFEHHNIVIEKAKFEDVNVFGFPNEFSQTILNILNNSKDAFDVNNISSAKVIISVFKSQNYGIVTIQDNGGGIDKKIIDRVFEPYFTTKEEGKGTGIGLYMSKIIVEQNMSGHLYVQNLNDGALFTVQIPLTDKNK